MVDGEIVAFDGDVTSFSRLQRRMQITDPVAALMTGVEVFYYVFDIPYVAGFDVTEVQLRHRKAPLSKALSFDDPLRYTTPRDAEAKPRFATLVRTAGRESSPSARTVHTSNADPRTG